MILQGYNSNLTLLDSRNNSNNQQMNDDTSNSNNQISQENLETKSSGNNDLDDDIPF